MSIAPRSMRLSWPFDSDPSKNDTARDQFDLSLIAMSSASPFSNRASSSVSSHTGTNHAYFSSLVSLVNIHGETRQKCTLCKAHHSWCERTSISSIQKHFRKVHHEVWKKRPRTEDSQDTSILDAFGKGATNAVFDSVAELFIHHPGLPISLCDSKHFRKVLKGTCGVTRPSIRQAILLKDEKYFTQLKELLKHKRVGIQIDGGKTVSKNKIIGICVVIDRTCYCFGVVSVEDAEILTGEWYRDLLLRVISTIESLHGIVVSVTLDNEASPNTGMQLLRATHPYLIHNRCYPHTAELLIADLQSLGTRTHPTAPAIPILHNVIMNVHKVVTAIQNSKYLRSALHASQSNRAVQKPLSLVKPANTRKWSTGFLMLARFCFLFNDVAQLEIHIASGERPEQCEIDAKSLWIDTLKPLVPPRNHCEAIRELLYWIYVGEQAMQKDGASVVHATFIFEEICSSLESTLPTARVPRLIQDDMDVDRVRSLVAERRTLLQSSGVYWMSLVLWPKATNYAYNHHADACGELETFITRCWPQWQRNREVLRLPDAFWCDAADSQSKLESFITTAQEQLTEHLIPSNNMISRHQASFETRSSAVASRLRMGDRVVIRGRVVEDGEDQNCVHVHQYWAAVAAYLPCLSMIARLLLACCASEAGVERMFSKEGFIHDSYRNRLGADILLALVRSCMNRHALDDEPIHFYSDDDSDSSEDND
jgi:hypothetical protein